MDNAGSDNKAGRIIVIDYLRGIALFLMALDHCMYFAGAPLVAESYGFKMPQLGPDILVIIGLVTNPASVIFFTLAGTSIALFELQRRNKGWSDKDISRFLLIKGCLLIGLDLIIQPFLWNEPQPTVDTLSALGCNIILLVFLRRLNVYQIGTLAAVLTFVYPFIVTAIRECSGTPLCLLFNVLFQYIHTGDLHVEFPILARLNLVLIGYLFGRMIRSHSEAAFKHLLRIGFLGLLGAAMLRIIGSYGNFTPYSPGTRFITFFIESKQPPSTVFVLFNFSIGVFALYGLYAARKVLPKIQLLRFLEIIGKTPLFFYVAHLIVYGMLVNRIADFHFVSHTWELAAMEFIGGMIILVPLSYYYRHFRESHPTSILRYL